MQPFAVPSVLPQDLLLIHDLIGHLPPRQQPTSHEHTKAYESDHDHGTDSDTDSEKEVEADILTGVDEDLAPSDSTSDSGDDSSDSESGSEHSSVRKQRPLRSQPDDEDDDVEHTANTDSQMRTKNELLDVDVPVPEISEVGPHEKLEHVGEIMSIIDKVVIVKGLPSSVANRGSERALDSDTLLVFEDRKVLGYVFETFGPTSEPLYQIRFNQSHPLDPENVRLGRSVFHVPTKSNYVFVQRLRHLKGSDASNVHDEEPGEDELEFSDDEQEAAHKRARADKREQSCARSVASSRHSTPLPSNMRDQDMVDDPYGGPSYTSSAYSDTYLDAGPSRPAPIPYDDPYSDSYGSVPVDSKEEDTPRKSPPPPPPRSYDRGRGRGGHNRGLPQRRDDGGRGRGRGRRQNDRGSGRGRERGTGRRPPDFQNGWLGRSPDEYDPHNPHAMSPAAQAIARVTGQQMDNNGIQTVDMSGGWSYPGAQSVHPGPWDMAFSYQYPSIQPHINPRFAANFGMPGMGMPMGYSHGNGAGYVQEVATHPNGDNWHENWGTGANEPTSQDGGSGRQGF